MIKLFTKQLILAVVAVIICIGGVFLLFDKKPTPVTQQQVLDSLNSEISALSIDNTRYEIILERVWEIDSNVIIEATKNIE